MDYEVEMSTVSFSVILVHGQVQTGGGEPLRSLTHTDTDTHTSWGGSVHQRTLAVTECFIPWNM